ncbi:MAG TPA: hypothetical protein VN911_02395 [Candidatus Acidoferrum sp.]|nr:hypothetical protein [Candidatus Acidoferrum sp.]
MRADVNIIVPILFMKDLPIPGHEHGDRIREQQHPCGNSAGGAVKTRMLYPSIFQIDGVHQVVQSHVGIAAAQTRQQRRKKS